MNIKELLETFKDSPADRTLARNLLVEAKVTYVPEKILGGYITLEDDSSKLEAVTIKKNILEDLKALIKIEKKSKFKGRLDKTEFGNIAFEIEEILE